MLLAHNGVGVFQNLKLLRIHRANDADSKTRAGERLTEHDVLRQPQRQTQLTHLVLKEVIQGLNEIKVHALREGNEVMVALDGRRLTARLARTALG